MNWQPIETAPKDGTEVLLWLGEPHNKVEKAKWFDPWKCWIDEQLPERPDEEEFYGIGSAIPTHWMPLPNSPKTYKPLRIIGRKATRDY